MADQVLQQGVRGITDLMVMPGLINLDFADVRSVMGEMGKAMMGTGEASGDNRAIEAAEKAIANPLLDGVSMKGAKGVIISITGGEDMRLMEVDEAANHIKELVDPDANIIWGSAFNNELEGRIRVSVVATGIEAEVGEKPEPARVFSFPGKKAEAEPRPFVMPAAAKPVEPAPAPEPVVEPAPEPELKVEPPVAEEEPLTLDAPVEEPTADELLLDSLEGEPEPLIDEDLTGGRRWFGGAKAETKPEPAPAARQGGGTLFERMSSIARGNAKAPGADDDADSDPLDIPRFLNRQNNQ
jgi:cell division protein FtsZ